MKKLILLVLALALIAMTPPSLVSADHAGACVNACEAEYLQCVDGCTVGTGCHANCRTEYRECELICYCWFGC